MNTKPNFSTIGQLQNAFTAQGSHFFDKETMRWWRSRVLNVVIDGRFFITSEKYSTPYTDDEPRFYTVREAAYLPDGSLTIRDVSEFHSIETRAEAIKVAREAAKQD